MAICCLQALLAAVASLAMDSPKHQRPTRLAPPQFMAATSTTIALRWAPPIEDGGTPVLGYALHGGAIGGPPRLLYDPLVEGSVPEPERRNHSAHGLRPNSTYVFQVACYNAVGRSQFSVLARATTAAARARRERPGPERRPERLVSAKIPLKFRVQRSGEWLPLLFALGCFNRAALAPLFSGLGGPVSVETGPANF